jgi:hypothetical protein
MPKTAKKVVVKHVTLRLNELEYKTLMRAKFELAQQTKTKTIMRALDQYMYYKAEAWRLQNEIDFINYEKSRK